MRADKSIDPFVGALAAAWCGPNRAAMPMTFCHWSYTNRIDQKNVPICKAYSLFKMLGH